MKHALAIALTFALMSPLAANAMMRIDQTQSGSNPKLQSQEKQTSQSAGTVRRKNQSDTTRQPSPQGQRR